MKAMNILVVVAAVVVIAGLTADAWAQCPAPELFRSAGKFGNNVTVDTTGSDNNGNQIGRFWDSDNANNSNNGLAGPDFGSLCPPINADGVSSWWQDTTPPLKKIDGFLTANLCLQTGCPAVKMTVVVEDYAAGGPPGVNADAYYVGWMVDKGTGGRTYDYGAVDGLTSATSLGMLTFPHVQITGSSRNAASITVNYDNVDQTNNNHTWNFAAGAVFPTSDVVAEWQLVKATGTADPGRLRSNGWVTIQTAPYVPGGAPATFDVPCSSEVTDEYIAIGIGFNGGEFGVIDSALVGKATQLECDPNLAEPDGPQEIDRKDTATEIERTGRSGGRR